MPPPATAKPRGWVYYDAECSWCTGWVRRMGAVWRRRGFEFVPLQSETARVMLGLAADTSADEVKVQLAEGRILGGADAVAVLCKAVWWLRPVGWMLSVPGMRELARGLYRGMACRRPTRRGRA